MIIEVEKLLPSKWEYLSEDAHMVAFGTFKPIAMDRIDFALLAKNENGLMGYITCREHDWETLYWQFGGAFPGTRESSLTFKAYVKCVEFCKNKYKRITTVIQNTNIAMLKMAFKVGFRIVGVRCFKGDVLLELLLEFS